MEIVEENWAKSIPWKYLSGLNPYIYRNVEMGNLGAGNVGYTGWPIHLSIHSPRSVVTSVNLFSSLLKWT